MQIVLVAPEQWCGSYFRVIVGGAWLRTPKQGAARAFKHRADALKAARAAGGTGEPLEVVGGEAASAHLV
jgi:hypothetical protein